MEVKEKKGKKIKKSGKKEGRERQGTKEKEMREGGVKTVKERK